MKYYYYVIYSCNRPKCTGDGKNCIGTVIVERDRKISSVKAIHDLKFEIFKKYGERNINILNFVLLKKDTDIELVDDLYNKKKLLKNLYNELQSLTGYKFTKAKEEILHKIASELNIKREKK